MTTTFNSTYAQEGRFIEGQVMNKVSKEEVPFALIQLIGETKGVVTDIQGKFKLTNVPSNAQVKISCTGYLEQIIDVPSNQTTPIKVFLEEDLVSLDEVVVKGETKAQEIEKSGFAVASIDTKDLQMQSLEINEILDQTAGLRVRRDGGLGSSTQININGLSGNAVRIFIDGMPMESYGSSYSINSIPVSLIERIDVYKGVVPIELGNDALGGAINIITKDATKQGLEGSSLNVAYSYGSFNTHRADINGSFRDKSGKTVRLSAFYNHSDNDYEVWSDDIKIKDYREFLPDGSRNPDFLSVIKTGERVKRFNDAYSSYGAKIDVGVTNKKWADQLFFSVNASEDYKESQHGARMLTPYGERYSRGWTIAPSVNYQKRDFLVKGLDINSNVQYAISQRATVDTTTNRYDWYGNLIPPVGGVTPLPGEGNNSTLNQDHNKNLIVRLSGVYSFNDQHQIGFNYSFNQYNRSSDDPMAERERRDFNTANIVNKQITGFTYQNSLFDDKLKSSVFVKHYYNRLEQEKIEYTNNVLDTVYNVRPDDNWGYGATMSYEVSPRVRINASAEQAVRLVNTNEVFGNASREIYESTDLQPEKSFNVNLGSQIKLVDNSTHELSMNTNFFFRDTYDRIRSTIIEQNDQSYTMFENIGHVVSKGVELQFDYNLGGKWNFMVQGYYLDSRFMEEFNSEGVRNIHYMAREPNMPYLTFNAGAGRSFNSLFNTGDRLQVNWNFAYIHEFHFDWDVIGDQNKPIIPTQALHDINVSYTFSNKRATVSLDCKNIFDQMAFDNFGVQKPGRSIFGKLTYRIN
ncbi:TonB-dependent receptor plug domain-containing protein [Flammeovirga yaeyamensis]|uniref:TonB-dependent receptor plug domain-containing protein n=1 Tax=Flammeovirga yaeyamensis TaxID=367791 RepID=A0AAX1N3K4_9BACT|nr:TonB-dependent receptor [Flammeovirga yaeyamensis]MBB3699590.1 outer membrane receptor protein involved in Fe transport [Flammeovirga yaeyamensis]NMF36837.1 TonB-dependent receptor [Flammeovirga yaeyamensis]QWG02124.1 TonB-dependent receptor plug domain-containing protein [Flammeovirga yaeyamensis]